MKPLLGAVADDFTGATDLANMLARGGMRTILRLGRPEQYPPVPAAEAVVVALKSRTAPVDEAVADSVAAWDWLAAAGARQCYFKYCSTFDSTPDGNIGPVALALMDRTGSDITIYCPAFPEAGRTICHGHLFVNGVPLGESPLKDHPLTPMTDANLMRWLEPQVGAPVGLIAYHVLEQGAESVRTELSRLRQRGIRHAVVDALSDTHLAVLADAVDDMPLVTAGSGLGLGLPGNYAAAGLLVGGDADRPPDIRGHSLLLSGSCSAATNAQVARWEADGGRLLHLDPLSLAEGKQNADEAWAWASSHGAPVLISATAPPERVRVAQDRLGKARAAEIVEETLAAVAVRARAEGVRRIICAGGETSGAIVSALGIETLAVGRPKTTKEARD